ncbi:DoxX family protein [Mycolicibacterium wolinskyi]|uniref:DoxX family protein n=1 Tax=Mycolicibacterium wolinskyi TaxID=59750 RepID=A0A1X2F1W8_9MYCO|nr:MULTISPECIES: DoxX family protein [Mycolicibacterium]MCV7287797.1 DoxX family protein [Mycolicibacterium wolinskyi]MCV7294695.1 DoxX family protein [Mycolicibacterium goodii]ORX12440.1 DoxX family protein [Mycolicibacterium wolinskyi]
MNVVLWILQGLLAAMFLLAGIMKSTQPREKLIKRLPWVDDVSTPLVRFIGIAELAGGIGLILPAVTGIATVLTPLAAVGLAVVMALAMTLHARRREPQAIAFNALLLIAAVVIAWGRVGSYAL